MNNGLGTDRNVNDSNLRTILEMVTGSTITLKNYSLVCDKCGYIYAIANIKARFISGPSVVNHLICRNIELEKSLCACGNKFFSVWLVDHIVIGTDEISKMFEIVLESKGVVK